MSNTSKKVLIRQLAGDVLAGYLPSHRFVYRNAEQEPTLDLLDLGGHVLPLPLAQIKMICYVRDFNLSDAINPERLVRRTFLARPRFEGLWVRLTLIGDDILEGIATADISFITNAVDDQGLHLTPPDTRSNTQRIFIPRTAITDLQLLAVITTPSRKKPLQPPQARVLQDTLFSTSPSEDPSPTIEP